MRYKIIILFFFLVFGTSLTVLKFFGMPLVILREWVTNDGGEVTSEDLVEDLNVAKIPEAVSLLKAESIGFDITCRVYRLQSPSLNDLKKLQTGYDWTTPPLDTYSLGEGRPLSLHVFRDRNKEIEFHVFRKSDLGRYQAVVIYKQ